MMMHIWAAGGGLILYLAALQGVPTTLYDAAVVDGANAWQKFWNVTLPLTSPVVFFVFLTGMIGSFQSVHGRLHRDRRRAGKRVPVLRVVFIPKRVATLRDGVRGIAGLGAVPDHHVIDPIEPAGITADGLLRVRELIRGAVCGEPAGPHSRATPSFVRRALVSDHMSKSRAFPSC